MAEPWIIVGRFRIDADSEEQARRALDAIERAAKRAAASTTIHIHGSEAAEDASRD